MQLLLLAIIGLIAGTASGLVGVGGGVVLVPLLVLFLRFSQHEAQGLSLAVLLPPTGLLAFLEYYRAGHVRLGWAAFLALLFFLGGWAGAKIATSLPDLALRRVFGGVLAVIGVYMMLTQGRGRRAPAPEPEPPAGAPAAR